MRKSSGSGKQGKSGGKATPMTDRAASRVQSSGDSNPQGKTSKSGFGPRAQAAAARNGRKT